MDLVYLDPPFNSDAELQRALRRDRTAAGGLPDPRLRGHLASGTWSRARLRGDRRDRRGEVARAYARLPNLLGAVRHVAYLSMMAPRLVELRRVLKPTGSIYLHCDPTASHYLKMLMDAVFGPQFFRNEIVWKRTSSHSDASQGAHTVGKCTTSSSLYAKWRPNRNGTFFGAPTTKHVESTIHGLKPTVGVIRHPI